ncbi:MAG: esterase/lipase family protein [Planctomycetota bacterium]
MRYRAALLLVLVAGCSREHGGSPIAAATTAPPSVAAPTSSTPIDDGVRPLVLVHGIVGSPSNWGPVIDDLGRGRTAFRDAYADDIAALPSGSVSRSSVWAVGYYKRRAADALYFQGRSSIGGCPVTRTDQGAGLYSVAYVDVLADCVEGILRATGADKVDLVGCSLGGVVTRAYLRWRDGATRVRRYLILESPSRGLNDIEAVALALDADKQPFQRWGEIAELARDYPAWSGRSYVRRLNEDWDAWVTSRGVVYGNLYGAGHTAINPSTFGMAVDAAKKYLAGSPASGAAAPSVAPSSPLLGTTSIWVALQQASVFFDLSRLDIARDVGEILSDADGFVRVSNGSAKAGPEFPHALFDSRFRGVHMDRGRFEETIQYCTNTRECIRRFVIQGRVPTTSLVAADLRVVTAGGFAPWLLLDYELAGGEGFTVQVVTEDEDRWNLRQAIPLLPDEPVVHAAPTFEGRHRIRLDGEPAGRRIAKVYFYDANGVAAEVGPLRLDVPPAQAGPELAPRTTLDSWSPAGAKATVRVRSTAKIADFSWRLVSTKGDASAWSAWSASAAIEVGPLPPGTYEMAIRSRHAENFARELVEDSSPLMLGVVVGPDGGARVKP